MQRKDTLYVYVYVFRVCWCVERMESIVRNFDKALETRIAFQR